MSMENDRPFPPSTSNLSRPLSLRPQGARPAPLGPRIRQASSNSSTGLTTHTERRSSHRDSTVSKTSTRSRESTLYSPGLASPARSEHDLPGISEQAPRLTASATENTGKVSRTPSVTYHESPVASSAPSPSPSPAPSVKLIAKSTTLIPPPQVTFENVSVPWKGLPLEAALWTLDSRELQDIVSRAIRSSARESFVRLISIQQLDETLPVELGRLSALKATTQSKYRFNVQRRTMLLQALMSYSGSAGGSGSGDKDGGGGTESFVSRLAEQLSETSIECDKLAQELVQIVGKMAQINQLVDVHWASALAIALRKLNGSYGKRTADLLEARQRIEQLEAELDDAWREAERMAQEIDDLDNGGDSDLEEEGTIQIKKAAVVPVSMQNGLSSPQLKSGTLMSVKAVVKSSPMPSRPIPESPIEAKAETEVGGEAGAEARAEDEGEKGEAQKESLEGVTQVPSTDTAADTNVLTSPTADTRSPTGEDDRASVHSKRSTKSTKSTKSQVATSRVSLVSAARKRSVRTSLGALRLPGHGRKISLLSSNSSAGVKSPSDGKPTPPVPEIPKAFSPIVSNPPSAFSPSSTHPPPVFSPSSAISPSSSQPRSAFSVFQTPSFLDLGSRNASAVSLVDGEGTISADGSLPGSTSASVNVPEPEPEPTPAPAPAPVLRTRRLEIDEISLDPIPLVPNRFDESSARERGGPTLVMDDLYVMPSGVEGVSSAYKQRKSVDDVSMMVNSQRRGGAEPKSSTIPSIWLHADTPKTPAERVESLMRSQTTAGKGIGKGSSSYSKLKELTRRYSLPFPFHGSSGKSSSSLSSTKS